MRRKSTHKKPRAKRSIPDLSYSHKRGTNKITINFPEGKKTLDEIIVMLLSWDWSPVDRLMKRNKGSYNPLLKKKTYKPPRGFTIVYHIRKRGNDYYWSEISSLEMVVNLENIQYFIVAKLDQLNDSWSSAKEVIQDGGNELADYIDNIDVRYLKSINIHFLY